MASGIFGRAVQYGTPAIVRAGSYLEKLSAELDHPAILIGWNDIAGAARLLAPGRLPTRLDQPLSLVQRLRARSVATIQAALGIQ
jgi:hypothetical protein